MNNMTSKTKQGGGGGGTRLRVVVEKPLVYFIVDQEMGADINTIPADFLNGSSCSFAKY